MCVIIKLMDLSRESSPIARSMLVSDLVETTFRK